MTRHTKPVPPILILDLISGDDEMETQEEMSLEHLPESVLHDIIRISGWLVENGRNQGGQHRALLPCGSGSGQRSPAGHRSWLGAEVEW